jgi:Fe2+ or Zn2+ uptake regulation protein
VYEQVAMDIPSISKATVYRILNQIAGEGEIVQRVQIPATAGRYDDHLGHHYHVRCNQCGLIADIDMPVMEDIYRSLPAAVGYEINGHDIVFNGVCAKCNKSRINSRVSGKHAG